MGFGFVVYVVQLVGELIREGGGGGGEGLVEDGDGYSKKYLSVTIMLRVVLYVTLCFKACVCEIVGFGFSSSDLELWLYEVFFLFFLSFRGFSHI